jgi:hypothetical protein
MIFAAMGRIAMSDLINHPSHYIAGKVECIDAIRSATTGLTGFEGFCAGCAMKYLWRWKRKGGAEDLRKCRWYVDRLIERLEGHDAEK